jgi:hypothetical protein
VICDELDSKIREFNDLTDLREYFLYFGILARNERDKRVSIAS